jgi:hypothetical protein
MAFAATLAAIVLAASPLQATPPDLEAAGARAESEGRPDDALRDYVAALQALPDPPPLADDLRLRERILLLVAATGSELPLSPEAEQHLSRARSLVEAQAELGGDDTGGLQLAADDLRRVVRLAPWSREAARVLAAVQQKLKQYEAAAGNLRLSRIGAATTPASAVPAPPAPSSAPPAARARVYVYWPPQMTGNWSRNHLRCGKEKIAQLQEGRVLLLELTPGFHTLDFGQKVAMEWEGGREYFLRASLDGFSSRKVFRVVPREEAVAEIRKKKMKPVDADHVFAAGCGTGLVPPAMP